MRTTCFNPGRYGTMVECAPTLLSVPAKPCTHKTIFASFESSALENIDNDVAPRILQTGSNRSHPYPPVSTLNVAMEIFSPA